MSKRITITLKLTPAQLIELEVATRVNFESYDETITPKATLSRARLLEALFSELRSIHNI